MTKKQLIITISILVIITLSAIALQSKRFPSPDQSSNSSTPTSDIYSSPGTSSYPSPSGQYSLTFTSQPPDYTACNITITQNQQPLDLSIPDAPCIFGPLGQDLPRFIWTETDTLILEQSNQQLLTIDPLTLQTDKQSYPTDWKIMNVSDDLQFWLFQDKQTENLQHFILTDDKYRPIGKSIDFEYEAAVIFIIETYYDPVNQLFLLIQRKDYPAINQSSTIFYQLDPITQTVQKIDKTYPIKIYSQGCGRAAYTSQPGSISITPGCFIIDPSLLDANGAYTITLP